VAGLSLTPLGERRAVASLRRARILLLGEYHPLPSALETAAQLLEASRGRPVALGLEMIHARDQAPLERFLDGRLGESEFRRRIRYEVEWGYPWPAAARLLRRARALSIPVLGLDMPPRGGVENLGWRDRVAARRIAKVAATLGPRGMLLVVFGEAHLAASHLPRALTGEGIDAAAVARVLHDLPTGNGRGRRDPRPLWLTDGNGVFVRQRARQGSRERALRRVVARWMAEEPEAAELDLPLLVHGLVDALARIAGIDPRRTPAGPARWLADTYPLVFGPGDRNAFSRWLADTRALAIAPRTALTLASRRGAVFIPEANAVYLARLSLPLALAQAALFLARALAPVRPEGERAALAVSLAQRFDPRFEAALIPGGEV